MLKDNLYDIINNKEKQDYYVIYICQNGGRIMRCPNCGCENAQFVTKESGKDYSVSDGCCGYMFLGPLGLLCGACGNEKTTEEFWVCTSCGSKFTEAESRSAIKEEAKAEETKKTCNKYKKELGEHSLEYFKEEYKATQKKCEAVDREYKDEFKRLADKYAGENEYAKQFKEGNYNDTKKWSMIRTITIISIILGIILLFMKQVIFGLLLIIVPLVISYNLASKESEAEKALDKLFREKEPTFIEFIQRRNAANKELERCEAKLKKAKYVDKNEENE